MQQRPLKDMDLLLILRGIIAATSEKVTGICPDPSVRVPLSVLCRAADCIAIARDASAATLPTSDNERSRAAPPPIPHK